MDQLYRSLRPSLFISRLLLTAVNWAAGTSRDFTWHGDRAARTTFLLTHITETMSWAEIMRGRGKTFRLCIRISLAPQQELPTLRSYPWLWKCLIIQFPLIDLENHCGLQCLTVPNSTISDLCIRDRSVLENKLLFPMPQCPEQQWPAFYFSLLQQHHHSKGRTKVNPSLWWLGVKRAPEISHIHQTHAFYVSSALPEKPKGALWFPGY